MINRVAIVLFCFVVAGVALFWLVVSALFNSKRAINIALGFDNTANATLGGDMDETLCSRAYRNHKKTKRWLYLMRFFNWLFANVEHDHCKGAFNREVEARRLWLLRNGNLK